MSADPVRKEAPWRFHNPVLPGFTPDPSVIRSGDDYWMVCSSFACFPGLPLFHSRDLVHWEQVGNVLSRPSQINLDGVGHSEGLFAPTIREVNGRFLVVCTLIAHGREGSDKGNFVVHAPDPRGPWSDPVWLPDAPGIDPSLFQDDDGRLWYCGTRERKDAAYFGDWEIWLQEMDPQSLKLKGSPVSLWRGALRDCIWPEGPHLYHIGEWYYLLHAEGGTDMEHAVCIARSKSLQGPWQGNPANPVLTHRHMGKKAKVWNVGHGDLVRTQKGEWWMVTLGSRPEKGYRNLGRETFLVPLEWVDGWPLFCRGMGMMQDEDLGPDLPAVPVNPSPACEHFDDDALAPWWVTLRTPRETFFSLRDRPGHLRLFARNASMEGQEQASFMGRRLQHHAWRLAARMDFTPCEAGEWAGICLVQNNQWQYRFELGLNGQKKPELRLVRVMAGESAVLAAMEVRGTPLVLVVSARDQELEFRFVQDSDVVLASGVDARILSTDKAGGFVGTLAGMHAFAGADAATGTAGSGGSAGGEAPNFADFDWFEYRGWTTLRE